MASDRYGYRGRASIGMDIGTGIGSGTESGTSSAFGTDIGSRSRTDIEGKTGIGDHRDIEVVKAGQFSFTKTVREVRFERPTIPEKGIVRISGVLPGPQTGLMETILAT